MKKFILLLCLFFLVTPAYCEIYSSNYYNEQTKEQEVLDKGYLQSLAFSENQIFKEIYSHDTPENRIERLEVSVYGAIQSGNIKKRIKEMKKAVTNISAGGYGLHYANKLFDLAGSNSSNGYWSIGNIPKTFSDYKPHFHSNRIYHPNCCSHRIPPRHHYNPNRYQKNSPIINGNQYSNYSMGTGVYILDD